MSLITNKRLELLLDSLDDPMNDESAMSSQHEDIVDPRSYMGELLAPQSYTEILLNRPGRPEGAQNVKPIAPSEREAYKANIVEVTERLVAGVASRVYDADGNLNRNDSWYRAMEAEMGVAEETLQDAVEPHIRSAQKGVEHTDRLAKIARGEINGSVDEEFEIGGIYDAMHDRLSKAKIEKGDAIDSTGRKLPDSWKPAIEAVHRADKAALDKDALLKAKFAKSAVIDCIVLPRAESVFKKAKQIIPAVALALYTLQGKNKNLGSLSTFHDDPYYAASHAINIATDNYEAVQKVASFDTKNEYLNGKAKLNEVLMHFGSGYRKLNEL